MSRLLAALPATALVLFWSSGFVGARLGTAYAPADTLLAWRYLIAAAVLVVVARMAGIRRPNRTVGPRQTVLGMLCQAGYLGGVVAGIGLGVPAGTAALMAGVQPMVVAALAGPLLAERVDRRQWWALGGGFVGVTLVVGGDVGAGTAPPWAYALPVGGMLALSLGTLLGRRWQDGESVLESLTLQTVVAAVAFTAVAAGRSTLAPPASSGFWWSVLWVICLSSFGGYGAYLLVLRRSGATRVSTLLYLTPPTTMAWSWFMFGDVPGPLTVPGVALCAVGVWLVLRAPRRDRTGAAHLDRSALLRAPSG